jgi:hypothetical protein
LGDRLAERGHLVGLCLREVQTLRYLPEAQGFDLYQAPQWVEPPASANPASYAEILLNFGYASPAGLAGLLGGWRSLFSAWKPDLVITDFAPTALLAARMLGLKRATYGNGFFTPPRLTPLPPFRFEAHLDAKRLAQADATALASVNGALAHFGAPPLGHLAQQFEADEDFLCTFPELDHYGARPVSGWWGPRFSVDGGRVVDWPAGPGKRVLVYAQPQLIMLEEMLTGLRARGHSVVAFVPGLEPARRAALENARTRLPEGLVRLDRLLPECDLVACHGGDIASGALASGIPLLLFPNHYEQHITALRIEHLRAGLAVRSPVPTLPLIDRLLGDPSFANAARAFAKRYAAWSPSEQRRRVLARIEQLVA